MSWSIAAVGRPAKVKEVLATQFENAKNGTKHIPAEYASVEQIEFVVNGLLDFAVEQEQGVVQVSASGSACVKSSWPGNIQTKLDFSPIYGFVE